MSFCNFVQNFLAKFFITFVFKHIVPILGTPLKMVHILANAMATANQTQNFSCAFPRVKNNYKKKRVAQFITQTKVWGFLAYKALKKKKWLV
jgi:hypothetical protein